jgi:hypothetical protein
LVGPDGNGLPLMTDAGGLDPVAGLTVTFSDAATNALPDLTDLTNGVYLPTDYNPGEFGTNATITSFAGFRGINPNGPWQLYVLDDTFGDSGSISGWSVSIEWQDPGARLINPRMLTNGLFQCQVQVLSGVSYVVEGSTNLRSWIPLSTDIVVSGSNFFIDTHSPQFPYRFYRVSRCQ